MDQFGPQSGCCPRDNFPSDVVVLALFPREAVFCWGEVDDDCLTSDWNKDLPGIDEHKNR